MKTATRWKVAVFGGTSGFWPKIRPEIEKNVGGDVHRHLVDPHIKHCTSILSRLENIGGSIYQETLVS